MSLVESLELVMQREYWYEKQFLRETINEIQNSDGMQRDI